MRARRTVKERDIVKILVFGYDRMLIKSIKDSGFRSMSDVISYANNMVGDKPIDHIRVSNEARVFIDSGYRNIAMVIADCGRIANGCYHIHHIEVVNMDRGWYGTYTLYGRKID